MDIAALKAGVEALEMARELAPGEQAYEGRRLLMSAVAKCDPTSILSLIADREVCLAELDKIAGDINALDSFPPSIQSQQNIRLVNAFHAIRAALEPVQS
jgi:hypothetical protein